MRYVIRHECRGRIRIHMEQRRMTFAQADFLEYYLMSLPGVTKAKVYERTQDAAIVYTGGREELLTALRRFRYENMQASEAMAEHSGRKLSARYQEKLIGKILLRCAGKLFIPYPVRTAWIGLKSIRYLGKALKCLENGKLRVEVLDATAIGVYLLRRDFNTAGSVMFLLGIGELLEQWTHKKSVDDLARSMSLHVENVWLKREKQEILVKASQILPGDEVIIRMGNVIPFDGSVTEGEATVNQSSMTGESRPVRKEQDGYVYAGTVVEEGELTIRVKATAKSTRFEKIVTMIEESEKLKSVTESRAERLADRLVPYTLGATALVWLLSGNITRALAVLMVDFSCALKLVMPIAVLSAIREADDRQITVKGGKYLEAMADADVIVFDKTGTLTEARPIVKDVVVFGDREKEEMLRVAACLEEHFPHPMARAVVACARQRGLDHEEMHSKVNYVVAHGISSSIGDQKVVIGSYHFVFEDEGCTILPRDREKFEAIPAECSHLYLAIDHRLAAVVCIEDPLRKEAARAIERLKREGIRKAVMMTGDSERTAASIAAKVGVDAYASEVLPEDKAGFIQREKERGHIVIMVGDGINDSPALSAADAGIAISDGAQIAREIADITIAAQDLQEIATLKQMSILLMRRIRWDYHMIVGINAGLILLGVASILGSVKNFVALVKNSSFLVRITDMTILIEKEFIYGSSKRPNPTDYYRKQHYQCG